MARIKPFLQLASLVLLDLVSFYLSLFLAVGVYTLSAPFFFAQNTAFDYNMPYFLSMWWVPLVYLALFWFEKLYQVRYPFWEESRILIKGIFLATLFILITVFIRNMVGSVSRFIFVFLGIVLLGVMPPLRFFGKKLLYRLGIWKENVLIWGAGESGIATLKGLVKEEHLGYNVVGFLDDDPKRTGSVVSFRGRDYKVYGSAKSFGKFVSILGIETVFIADSGTAPDVLADRVNEVYKEVKRVIIIPDIKGVAIFNSDLHYLFMEKLFLIKVNNNLHSITNRFIKRAFDLTVSLLGLLVTSPVFLVIALLVKITSPGPIVFAHKRVGRGGREFPAYKFRTMYRDSKERLEKILANDPAARAEWEKSYKLKNDPRITPLGKILRATSLDEIPQVFNIIFGHMSLVGPRPVIMEEIEKYYGDSRDYYYSVRPGLSGLWQVSGRSNTDYAFRIETDAWYVQNWSLWLDIIILFKTVPAVLKREGAY